MLLPGLDSFSAAVEIRRLQPAARIAILTSHALPDQLLRTRRLRLNGFILKRDASEELFYAIRTILTGGFYSPPSMSTLLRDQVDHQDPLAGLTQREKSILTLYAQGLSLKEIADELNISVKTAETHRNNLGRKLGHPNRSQITAFALKHHPALAASSGQYILTVCSPIQAGPFLTGRHFRSNTYMSMTVSASSAAPRRSAAYRRICAQVFAGHIRAARLRDGRPLDELAPLAGLTVEEWEEIEAGRVPGTWEHVLLLVTVLQLDRSSWLPYFARLCEGAQER